MAGHPDPPEDTWGRGVMIPRGWWDDKPTAKLVWQRYGVLVTEGTARMACPELAALADGRKMEVQA